MPLEPSRDGPEVPRGCPSHSAWPAASVPFWPLVWGEGCSVKEYPRTLQPCQWPWGSLQVAIIFFFPLSIMFWPKLQSFWSKSGRYFFPRCCGRGQAPFRRSFKFRMTRAISLRTGIITFQFTPISAQHFLSMTLWTQVSTLLKQIYKHLYLKKKKAYWDVF